MARGRAWLLVFLLLAFAGSAAAEVQETKRVLIVHSFGSTAPPFTTHSTAFEAALAREMGKRVDLDEVSLDMARYAQPDMEGPFVEFLLRRLAKWQPDLVVPIGSPAGRFVAKYRDRLFPLTPIVYTGMDRRTLPPDAFQRNATFVGENFNLAGLVEDILQLAPDTTNIMVVLGASPLERYWTVAFRQAFEPFTDRVNFTWVNDLSFDQMLERAARLPPRSFILLGLLIRDAAGVTHNEDDALQRLRAVANAPVNGLYQHQLGLGIVGGRLYQAELQGEESARIAIRILRGEPVSNFPPLIIGTQGPRYDGRELERWKIGKDRLPPGSVIAFRPPTMWERSRWWILGGSVITLLQAGLIILLAVNLTRRRRMERALRESEDRVNLAAESAGAGLWSVDVGSRRVWATPRLRELFGFAPAAELNELSFLEAMHRDDRERVREIFSRSSAEGPGLNQEFRIVRSDGTTRWVAMRGHLDPSRKNGAGRWSGACVDITERKLTEERLRESESRFRMVADSAPVLIWMSDTDKSCTFLNKPWFDFTGRTAAQELGGGWTEGVHPDDLAGYLKSYGEAFDGREPFVLHYRVRRHDGEYRWVADNGVPRYDAQGNFAGYIGSCSDITERLRAEDKFRQVFERAPNAMIMVDGRGTMVLVNAQVEALFGYQRGELIGLPIETLIPEHHHHQHARHRGHFMRNPHTRAMGAGGDLFGRRKDGVEVAVEVGLNPIFTVDGLFVVASVTDISGRRRAEAESRRLQQEVAHISRIATMGELLAAIVHELGQPMTAILANAQAGVRLMGAGHEHAKEIRDILDDIVADERRANQVIARLRALFRKGEGERQPLTLSDLIDDVVSMVRADADLRQVSIKLDVSSPLPQVAGDRVQLQQVLLNVFVNAFEAMAERTDGPRELTVRACALGDERVKVDVADTGPGIAADNVESLFEPFVTTKPGGMGMGLSVASSIVRAHDGQLWATNNPDIGATFYIVLPAMPDETAVSSTT